MAKKKVEKKVEKVVITREHFQALKEMANLGADFVSMLSEHGRSTDKKEVKRFDAVQDLVENSYEEDYEEPETPAE